MSERDRGAELHVDEDAVREEHMAEVDVRAHALYLLGVLGGATFLMLVFMVLLDATT